MSNIEALYLVGGFWLAAIPLTAKFNSLRKAHAKELQDMQTRAYKAVEQAKLDTWQEANERLDQIRRANAL